MIRKFGLVCFYPLYNSPLSNWQRFYMRFDKTSTLIYLAKLLNVAILVVGFYCAHIIPVAIIAFLSLPLIFKSAKQPMSQPPSLAQSFTLYAVVAVISIMIGNFFAITDTTLDKPYWKTLTATVPKASQNLRFMKTKTGGSYDDFLVLEGERFRCLEVTGAYSSCPRAYAYAGKTAIVSYVDDEPQGYLVYEMTVEGQPVYTLRDREKGIEAIATRRHTSDKWLFLLFVLPAVPIYLLSKFGAKRLG